MWEGMDVVASGAARGFFAFQKTVTWFHIRFLPCFRFSMWVVAIGAETGSARYCQSAVKFAYRRHFHPP